MPFPLWPRSQASCPEPGGMPYSSGAHTVLPGPAAHLAGWKCRISSPGNAYSSLSSSASRHLLCSSEDRHLFLGGHSVGSLVSVYFWGIAKWGSTDDGEECVWNWGWVSEFGGQRSPILAPVSPHSGRGKGVTTEKLNKRPRSNSGCVSPNFHIHSTPDSLLRLEIPMFCW